MNNLAAILSASLVPRDSRSIVEYAHDNIELFPPITKTGPFSADSSRHFLEIFDALDDERVREVNILKPVRGGGSLIGDVWLSATLPKDRNSGPFMQVFQTDADARMHFCDRVERMMNGNACTRDLLPLKYEWSEIRLTNGHTLYTGGPALSNLQSKGVRFLRLTECWLYPPGRLAEAEARVGDYLKWELSKILRESQAGARDGIDLSRCDWHRSWNRCGVHEWEVQCLHCQAWYEPIFNAAREDGTYWGITWDQHKLPNGDHDLAKCCTTIRFECPHCRKPSLDGQRTKAEWNRTGRYKLVGEENRKRKGFHWETVIDFPWDELVMLWLDACNAERRGDLKPKLQFYQKRRAIFKDEESLLRGGLHFRRIAYEITTDWPDEVARFLTIDRQQEDMFWWTVRAWSKDKSRRLGFGKAYGFAAVEEIRDKFKVQPSHTFCDSAYNPKGDHGVYTACLRYGWIAVRGSNEYDFSHPSPRGRHHKIRRSYSQRIDADPNAGTTEEGKRYCPLIMFSKPQFNQIVQRLVESGAFEEPMDDGKLDADMEKEYSAQMAARVRRVEYDSKTNQPKIYWYESKNDHARDLANMQVLGAVLRDLLQDPANERLAPIEEKQQAEKEQTT